MRSRVPLPLALAFLLLAGCASPQEPAGPEQESPLAAAEDVAVEATASTGVIRGVVVDEAVRPVAGATLRITNAEVAQTVSNAEGGFGFEDLAPMAYILTVTHPRYDELETAVNVEVAIDEPPVVKIVLVANATKAPRVVPYQGTTFVSSAFCLQVYGCNAVISGQVPTTSTNDRYYTPVDEGASTIQVEASWSPTTPLAETGALSCSGFADDGSVRADLTGPSSLVVRLPGTFANDDGVTQFVDALGCELRPHLGSQPAAIMANQDVDFYVHVFYNFEPPADWVFSRDGAPKVPE